MIQISLSILIKIQPKILIEKYLEQRRALDISKLCPQAFHKFDLVEDYTQNHTDNWQQQQRMMSHGTRLGITYAIKLKHDCVKWNLIKVQGSKHP